jgi:cytochrome c-type biogenesis protein CcmF
MWWSYEVLGWGGYWAWDPVENASFIPWLTATAFLHSVMVQERRGMLKLWNLNLIVATFALTILGTFLTRSGVLSSVHAFTQGTIGYYFLAFIAVVLLASFAMVAGNSEGLRQKGSLDAAVSRESVFLLNNLFFTAFTVTVLVGTLYPLVAEAFRGVKVSVGGPFYNRMTIPVCAALLFLMGVGPALPWKRATPEWLKRQFLPPAIGALVGAIIAFLVGMRQPYAILVSPFAAFALVANTREYITGMSARRRAHGESPPVALVRLVAGNRRRYGGYLAHLGIICMAVAITASSVFRSEQEATLKKGDTLQVQDFTLRLTEVWGREEPQRTVIGATLLVSRDGRELGRLEPRMNFYPTSQQPVPTPAVRSRPAGDLYLSLMAFTPDGAQATINAIVEPLVPWIWIGGGIICLGAIVAGWPARRRAVTATARVAARVPDVSPVPSPALEGAVREVRA